MDLANHSNHGSDSVKSIPYRKALLRQLLNELTRQGYLRLTHGSYGHRNGVPQSQLDHHTAHHLRKGGRYSAPGRFAQAGAILWRVGHRKLRAANPAQTQFLVKGLGMRSGLGLWLEARFHQAFEHLPRDRRTSLSQRRITDCLSRHLLHILAERAHRVQQMADQTVNQFPGLESGRIIGIPC